MKLQARASPELGSLLPFTLFTVGFLLLLAIWLVLFWWISLFTEALLAPWSYGNMESMPAPGTWPGTVNDFFSALPGSILPSITMILIGVFIFSAKMIRAKNRVWLPLLFVFLYIGLLAADVIVTNVSWALSNWLVGPRVGGIDAGYHRTWYGIIAHLVLWGTFYAFVAKAKILRT